LNKFNLAIVFFLIFLNACENNETLDQSSEGFLPSHTIESPLVEINGRQLLINGIPTLVKGIDYSPVQIGQFPPGSDIPSDSCIYERDTNLLKGIGANLLRLYGMIPNQDPGIIKLATDTDIFLALGFPILPYTIQFCAQQPIRPDGSTFCINGNAQNQTLDPNTDNGKQLREMIKSDFTDYYKRTCNLKNICFYLAGNEVGIGTEYNTLKFKDSPNDFYSLLNELAAIPDDANIKTICPNPLPVSTALIDLNDLQNPNIQMGDNVMTNLKFWASNVFRGCKDATNCNGNGQCEIPTMTNFFQAYKGLTSKPVFVSEYGIDAYDNVNEMEDGKTQAQCTTEIWRSIETNATAGNSSQVTFGGAVFEYTDEWWKCGNANTQETCGFANANFPDGFSNESWYGLFSISQGNGCNQLTPRKIFTELPGAWIESN